MVRQWNLSYECLTGVEARSKLRTLKNSDPDFWAELTCKRAQDLVPPDDVHQPEDNATSGLVVVDDDVGVDDSDVTMEVLLESMAGRGIPEGFILTEEGGISSNANAEGLDEDDVTIVQGIGGDVEADETQRGRGKRRKTANRLYNSKDFWRYNESDSD